ncbi:MAG: ABC transporter permease [Planctomycetota bacterium]
MSKIWTVTVREYLAAVKTKGFIVGLIMMPILMGFGFVAGQFAQSVGDGSTRKVAIIDHTGGTVYDMIEAAVERHNAKPQVLGSGEDEDGEPITRQTEPKFVIERIDATDLDTQRVDLSDRVRSGELLAFVEVGEDLLQPKMKQLNPDDLKELEEAAQSPTAALGAMDILGNLQTDSSVVRYVSNKPTYRTFTNLLNRELRQPVQFKRMANANINLGVVSQVMQLATPMAIQDGGLYEKTETGEVAEERKGGRLIAAFAVPIGLLAVMFLVVMTGVSPMTTNVIEEKQLRIAEVLLSGARPFEIMMGKLLGGVGTALTLGIVYVAGAYATAAYFGFAQFVPPMTLVWFVVFTILTALLFGAMFTAAGAAVNNIKEAQSLMTPIILLLVVPISLVMPVVEDPNSTLSTFLGLFPFTASIIGLVRLAVPPGVPLWQTLLAVASSLAGTIAVIWLAGRIFRVGMLSYGKAPTPRQLVGWVLKG